MDRFNRNQKRGFGRLQNRVVVLQKNLLKPKNILLVVLILILTPLLTILLAYFSINITYSNRLLSSIENFPEEIESSIVIVDREDINNSTIISQIASRIEELYLSREISKVKIYFLDLEDMESELRLEFPQIFSKVNSSDLSFNFLNNNIKDVCIDDQNQSTNRGIIFTDGSKILRATYLCNFFGLYYTGFRIEENEEVENVNFVNFSEFVDDLFNILLKPKI